MTKEPRFYLDKAEIFFLRLTLLYLFAHYCTKGTHLFLYLGKVCDPDETRLVLPQVRNLCDFDGNNFCPATNDNPQNYEQIKDKTVQQSRLKSLGNIPLSEAPSMHTLSCTKQGLIPVSKVTERGKQHMYN